MDHRHDVPADMSAVESLCEMQLQARRLGCTIRVCDAAADLRELILLSGLGDLLLCAFEGPACSDRS